MWLQMTGAHTLFRLNAPVICDPPPPARMNVEDFDFVSAVAHSNHHTVGAASWQNYDNFPPAVCYYTAQQCLSRSIKPLHFFRIVETT